MSAATPATATNSAQAGLRAVAQALANAPLEALATAIAKDDSTVCRIRSEEGRVTITDAVRLLYAAGLKVVSQSRICVDRETYDAMTTIASKAMSDAATVRRLTWDDES